MVEIALPPTRESVEEARPRDLERAVIDVRFALARETTVEGSCLALVCDSKYSYWRVLDASDPRYEEVCGECPRRRGSTARRRAESWRRACARRGFRANRPRL